MRENLKISLTHKKSNEDAFKLMNLSLKDDFPNQCGIIYCTKKADCEKLTTFLVKEGYSATFYHGEVPKDEQKRRLANWMSGQVKVCFYLLLLVFLLIHFQFLFLKLKMIVLN